MTQLGKPTTLLCWRGPQRPIDSACLYLMLVSELTDDALKNIKSWVATFLDTVFFT